MAVSNNAGSATMGMWSVAALGIGTMVGAGIFALLGQVALASGKGVYAVFLFAGVIALLSGHSFAKLAARYPTAGGLVDYFDHAFPSKLLSGTLGLIYLVTLVVTVAMVAKAFGAYGGRLLFGDGVSLQARNGVASVAVVVLALVNSVGEGAVGRLESLLVAVKLSVLAVLMVAGIPSIRSELLEAGAAPSTSQLAASIGLAFFAYAGYGMMANAAASVRDPAKTIGRAIFLAIGVVVVLYVGLALVVLGNVTPIRLARFADTAMAEAAVPVLGPAGFVMVSVAALLSTASAINATLFSGLRISTGLAQAGQLPRWLGAQVWRGGTRGLIAATGAILLMTNLLDLSAVASVASATFLVSYVAVFVAHWRLRVETGSASIPIALGLLLMVAVLGAFLAGLWRTDRVALGLITLFLLACTGGEALARGWNR